MVLILDVWGIFFLKILHLLGLLLVAPAAEPTTVDAQAADDPASARFAWTIENFSRLNVKKLYSEVFYVGGYKWSVPSLYYIFLTHCIGV